MWDTILRVFTVYVSSMLKFIFGPVGGYAAGLNIVVTILITVCSMMTVVLILAFFGDFIRQRLLRRFFNTKKFTERNRKYVWIWRRYGLYGIALLTPILLTPIGGTLLAISFGTPKNKLILFMFVSASAWALILSSVVYFFGNEFVVYFFGDEYLPEKFR
jgi:membrane protein DedA with SNARE-associated domain